MTSQDSNLDDLMKEFENSIRDLRIDCSDGCIKTCIQKQVNLLEWTGKTCPGVTERDLGGICNQLGTWPHQAIKTSLKNLYRFASDYPGIRHGSNHSGAIRSIEMRDKELRFDAADGVWRFAFAFDPNRQAIVLCGGGKSGVSEKKLYRDLIRKADERFDAHVAHIKREKQKEGKKP